MTAAKAESFGACLYAVRCQKDLSQRALARAVGASAAYVSTLENERRLPPPVATVKAWAKALQLSSSANDRLMAACRRAQKSETPMDKDAKRVLAMCRRLGPRIPADALLQFEQRLRDLL